MKHETKNIVGYCTYCKESIYEGDDYVVSGGEMYHPDCYGQMNTFYDPFDLGE